LSTNDGPRNSEPETRDSSRALPAEVREVADALIADLEDNLRALLWHGSWARGEQTPESDHDMIVVVRQMNEATLLGLSGVFDGRSGWSTYVKTEQELRHYPLTGRLQFHYGFIALYGGIDAPPVTREGIIEDLRRTATDVQHECRYRLIHGSGGKLYAGMDPAYARLRTARWMYYQAKLAVLALKAREVLRGQSYPLSRHELRRRLSDEEELAIIDIIDLWPALRQGFEEDVTPLALQLDAFMRKLVNELEEVKPPQ